MGFTLTILSLGLCNNCRKVKVNRLTRKRKKPQAAPPPAPPQPTASPPPHQPTESSPPQPTAPTPHQPTSSAPHQPQASASPPHQPQPQATEPFKHYKVVIRGPRFWEHVFPPKNENFIGIWEKCGTFVDLSNPSAKELLSCDSCINDRRTRNQMFPPSEALRSYQVRKVTKQNDFWLWEAGQCENKNCWGQKTRQWQVQRQKNQYLFTHKTSNRNVNTEVIDKLYINMLQGSDIKRCGYFGVGRPVGRCAQFRPMFNNEDFNKKRHVSCEMSSRKVLPENLTGIERSDCPPYYQENPDFVFPNKIIFKIYEEPEREKTTTLTKAEKDKLCLSVPDTQEKLEKAGWPEVARTYVFMYPGGAGCRVEQFRNMEGKEREERERLAADDLPNWWPEGKISGYIKDVQGGWAGPITSFYRRIDTANKFYS